MELNVKENKSFTNDAPAEEPQSQKKVLLTSIEVTDENVALNLIVSFLGLAQKRGAFTIDEAAKIWECIKRFQK